MDDEFGGYRDRTMKHPKTPRHLPTCVFCGTTINPNQPGVYQEVSGWAQHRTAGGANKITLPVRGDLYACRECIDKKRSGININQDQLW